MRTEGRKYILENQAECNNSIFLNVRWSKYYRGVPESSGWRVVLGFKKPGDPDWWEMEIDWAWLAEDLRINKMVKLDDRQS